MSEFAKVLEDYDLLKVNWRETTKKYQEECDAFFAAEFKKQFPKKKKYDFNLIVGYEATLKNFQDTAKAMQTEYSAKCKEYEGRLNNLSDTTEIPITEDWYEHYQSSGYYYSSQTQAEKYAEGSCKRVIGICEMHDVESKYTWEKQEISPYLIHKVWIRSNRIGSEILNRRKYSLKDFVKSCWKAGVNPRVYNPFLPYGIEEEYGLDYHGNEKVKEEVNV